MNIKLTCDPPAALITLNRPKVHNALSPTLIREFERALDEIERRNDLAVVIVTGAGSAFSAGADLRGLKKMTSQSVEAGRQDSLRMMSFFRRLYEFPRPVIAAVNGPALGGGCGLATVCDVVIASKEAIFGYPEVKVGFVAALVTVFLLRICGEKKVRELLLTGRTFQAEEAREMGLVNHVVGGDTLLSRAREMALSFSRNSPTSLRLTKELLGHLGGLGLDQALELAADLNALSRTTADFKEGVNAFLEKRDPVWKRE